MKDEGGDPPPSSVRNPRAVRVARETPQPGSALSQRAYKGERRRGTPPKLQHAHHARGQEREGATLTRQHATLACIQGGKEEGNPPYCSVRTLRTACRIGAGGNP